MSCIDGLYWYECFLHHSIENLILKVSVRSQSLLASQDDEDEDDDSDDEDVEDSLDETALESFTTPLDKEDCDVDEYQVFKDIMTG